MKYLVGILNDTGEIEFAEIPTAEYWTFRDGLRQGGVVQIDMEVLRHGQELVQKQRLTESLKKVWEKRQAAS